LTNKHKLCSIALVSIAMVSMLISIAGAAPFAYIPNCGSNNVSVIDTATNTVTTTVPVGSTPWGVAVAPDGTKVYVTNEGNNNVSVINITTNTVVAMVPVGTDPKGIAITPDGKKAYVANWASNNVSVINTTNNTAYTSVTVGSEPFGVAVTPDGTKVYVTNYGSNKISIINTTNNTAYANVNGLNWPYGIAVTPDETKVYVANDDVFFAIGTTVSVINIATNTVVATVPVGNYPNGVAVTPDGSNIYVTNGGSNNVSVINTTNNSLAATVTVGVNPQGVAVTPDGSNVYVTNENDGTVSIINTATNNITDTIDVGSNPIAFGQFIGKSAPIITWSNPDDITYGTPLNNTQLDATASVPGNFSYDPPSGTVLNVGSQQILNTTFTPDDTLNYINTSATVLINITQSTPTITWNNPADITYGTVLDSTQLNAIASDPISGNPLNGIYIYDPPSGTLLGAGSQQTLNTTFIPDDTLNYTNASASVLINVTQATPTITWNNPPNITYGTPLYSTQLDATCSVPGNYSYNPATGTILSAGQQQQLTATLTPNDIENYTTAYATTLINVTQATPTITWNNPVDITYGTALSSTQLDAIGSVPGPITYNPIAGTILSANQHQQLTATLTPNDSVNYTTASASVSINVTQVTPIINWSKPADIVYGTALCSTQLDASASVPGTFIYNPPSGTILSAGTQTLDVSLTPTDNVNYTIASANVKINVLAPTQKINQMINFIQGITTSGELDEGSSYELIAILSSAETNLDRIESDPSVENPFVEPTELRYFISQVKDKMDRGILSPSNGQLLINSANDIINA